MLGEFESMAMVAVKDQAEAKQFYGETLGLKQLSDNPAGTMYGSGSGGGRIFVYQAPTAGTSQATSVTWEVADIKNIVDGLKTKGVSNWEQYEYPGAEHDGEVHIMGGMKAAWFRDPSGNILGLSEMS